MPFAASSVREGRHRAARIEDGMKAVEIDMVDDCAVYAPGLHRIGLSEEFRRCGMGSKPRDPEFDGGGQLHDIVPVRGDVDQP